MPPTDTTAEAPSLWRAWFALVRLSLRRQTSARQMVWIALALVGVTAALAAANTARGVSRPRAWGWGMHGERWPRHTPGTPRKELPAVRPTYLKWAEQSQEMTAALPMFPPEAHSLQAAVLGASRAVLTPGLADDDGGTVSASGFEMFSEWVISSVFLTFLLPLCSLAFAVEVIGGERESQSLIWLLARPIPRPLIYLAKFVALLPWAVGLNLGGFAVVCLAGGGPGRTALWLYWPAVLAVTITFASLFLLVGAYFKRPAVVAIIYSFCIELVLGSMPGYLKYLSVSYYARCMMFRAGGALGVLAGDPDAYLSDQRVALAVLLGAAAVLLALGMYLFSWKQYHEIE